jgi:hypothetical protein
MWMRSYMQSNVDVATVASLLHFALEHAVLLRSSCSSGDLLRPPQ